MFCFTGQLAVPTCFVQYRPRLGEDFVVQFGEEGFVQTLDNVGDFVFFDHERQIDLGGALRDHADFLVFEFTKDAGRDSRSLAKIFSHQADDRFAALVLHIGQLRQIRGQGGDGLIRIDGERDADFRGGNHIDRDLVAVKGFEDGLQESVGQQHARGGDVDDGDALFGGDSLEDVFAMRGAGGDAGTFARGIARV